MERHTGTSDPQKVSTKEIPITLFISFICRRFIILAIQSTRGREASWSVNLHESPTISHLLFADDSLLFCRANQEEVQVVIEVLQTYAASLGQCINFEKFSIYFSSNTAREQRDNIKGALGVREVDMFDTYLGLPTLVGRSKFQTFSFLKDQVWKKIQGWKGQLLSKARREVLIKAVAQFKHYVCKILVGANG